MKINELLEKIVEFVKDRVENLRSDKDIYRGHICHFLAENGVDEQDIFLLTPAVMRVLNETLSQDHFMEIITTFLHKTGGYEGVQH